MTAKPTARKPPRWWTCGLKRGTFAGSRRHRRAGEATCYRCYRALARYHADRDGRDVELLTRRELRAKRRAARSPRSADYERGYHAGYAVGRRHRDAAG